jgi:hypothetical protein
MILENQKSGFRNNLEISKELNENRTEPVRPFFLSLICVEVVPSLLCGARPFPARLLIPMTSTHYSKRL